MNSETFEDRMARDAADYTSDSETPRTDALHRELCLPFTTEIPSLTLARTLESERALLLAKVRAYLEACEEERRLSDPCKDAFAWSDAADRRNAAESALRAVVDAMEGR